MYGKSIPRRLNAVSFSDAPKTKTGLTHRSDAAASSGGWARARSRKPMRLSPRNSPTAGCVSSARKKSAGSLPFPRDGIEPTTRPLSSGAAQRSRWCGKRPIRNVRLTDLKSISSQAARRPPGYCPISDLPFLSQSDSRPRDRDRFSPQCTRLPRSRAGRRYPVLCC